MINTEEDKFLGGADAGQKSHTDYIIKDIQENKNAKHIFIFMHRPLWIEDKKIWGQIEAELNGANYTVFAGHYHSLTHDTRGTTTITLS